MDFFTYANLTAFFAAWFGSDMETWVQWLVGGICFAVVFVFQAIALYVISGREGYNNRWMSFVPFFSTYYVGVCAQKNRLFKAVDTKKFALATAILEFALFIGYLIANIASEMLFANDYLKWVTEEVFYGVETGAYVVVDNLPSDFAWAAWCFNYLDTYILQWVDLIYLVMDIMLLVSFFRTFAPRRYVLFTVTSVLFPIRGILFFVVRNNNGMNYRDFIRGEQERQYRMYQQYNGQNYNQNPYNQNYNQNPYNRNPNQQAGQPPQSNNSGTPEDPFSNLGNDNGGNDSDPFDLDGKN